MAGGTGLARAVPPPSGDVAEHRLLLCVWEPPQGPHPPAENAKHGAKPPFPHPRELRASLSCPPNYGSACYGHSTTGQTHTTQLLSTVLGYTRANKIILTVSLCSTQRTVTLSTITNSLTKVLYMKLPLRFNIKCDNKIIVI